jgi:tyrosinase
MDDVPGMQISVVWVEMRPARSESEFPKVVGEYKVLEGATEGRTGGSR